MAFHLLFVVLNSFILLITSEIGVGNTEIYNSKIAEFLVDFSAAAYCNPSIIESWTCPSCKSIPVVEAATFSSGSRGFIALVNYPDLESDVIVISFSGTDPTKLPDFITDLSIADTPSPHPGCIKCRAHRGFFEAWLSVQDQVIGSIDQLLNTYVNASVIATGHSMGGALALHCALALRERGIEAHLYTFGSPKVGNAAFTEYAAETIGVDHMFRVTHRRDPIIFLPPSALGYSHVPREIFYKGVPDGKYAICDSSTCDPTCSIKNECSPINIFYALDHVFYLHMNFVDNWFKCKLSDSEAEFKLFQRRD